MYTLLASIILIKFMINNTMYIVQEFFHNYTESHYKSFHFH